jgi:CheY-like chemotaxis protein
MNVLYADDDVDDREIFCEVIKEINPAIKVVLGKDGIETLKILSVQKELPDLIFLDINMPRMDGIECLVKIKSDDRLKGIPVIIYSTTSNKSDVTKISLLGASDFILKGNSYESVKESLHKILTSHRDFSYQ